MIFGKLACGHFDVLISQYCHVKKSCLFGCAKIVFWLHTVRNKNPDTPQTHPSASDFHECHSGILIVGSLGRDFCKIPGSRDFLGQD